MWCFQGVEKRCIGEEWVNTHWKHQKTSGFMFSGGYKKRSVAWNGLKGSVSKNWSSSSATLKTWDKFNKMSTAEFFEFPSKSSKTYNLFSLVCHYSALIYYSIYKKSGSGKKPNLKMAFISFITSDHVI